MEIGLRAVRLTPCIFAARPVRLAEPFAIWHSQNFPYSVDSDARRREEAQLEEEIAAQRSRFTAAILEAHTPAGVVKSRVKRGRQEQKRDQRAFTDCPELYGQCAFYSHLARNACAPGAPACPFRCPCLLIPGAAALANWMRALSRPSLQQRAGPARAR